MRRRIAWLLAAGLATGLVAAGCGDDDDDGEAVEALTKAGWIQQADQICAEGDREIEEAARETFAQEQPSEEGLEQFAAEIVVPEIQSQIDQIRELPPPEGEEEQVAAILDAAQDGVDRVEQDPTLLAQGEDAGGAFAEANRLSQEYGLEDCGG